MIHFPLCTTMLSGIRDILAISTLEDLPLYRRLLGGGSKWRIALSYTEQHEPRELADALIVEREFPQRDRAVLVLGDNILYGYSLPRNPSCGSCEYRSCNNVRIPSVVN